MNFVIQQLDFSISNPGNFIIFIQSEIREFNKNHKFSFVKEIFDTL